MTHPVGIRISSGDVASGYSKTHLYHALMAHLATVAMTALTVFSVQFFYADSQLSMSWYSDMRYVVPLYVLPPLTVGIGAYTVVSFVVSKKVICRLLQP